MDNEEVKTDPDWVVEKTEQLPIELVGYELELWLSTDGKHTVRILVKDPTKAKEAVKKAEAVYDYILNKYGTKQAQAVKEYTGKTSFNAVKTMDTTICSTCGLPAEEKSGISKKGKAYHMILCSSGNKDHTKWLKP